MSRLIFVLGFFVSSHALGASKPELSQKLFEVRSRILSIEKEVVDGSHAQNASKFQVKKIHSLIQLQRQEQTLIRERMSALGQTVGELNSRRAYLDERIRDHRRRVRVFLENLKSLDERLPKTPSPPEEERQYAPLRRTYRNLVSSGLKEVEILKVDLADAEMLGTRIQEEKDHLAYLIEELKEQEAVLEMNQQLQSELIQKRTSERLSHLENYRKLKTVELQVEQMMQQFNARKELQESAETERHVSRELQDSRALAHLHGKLPFPVIGRVVGQFGKSYDPRSRLVVFKKGVEIEGGKLNPVKAVYSGKVAFSGELPHYGKVTILDHGNHFYSLCANLGALEKKTGDALSAGDLIGQTDDAGTPVYFEIRSKNVALNPLQWLVN